MNDYKNTLKRVGISLVIIGILDIAYMIYSISMNQNYSSSLNIFSILAGIFLIRGSLKAVRPITWLAAFLLTFTLCGVVALPFIIPTKLILLELKLHPLSSITSVLLEIASILVFFWIYRELRSTSVIEARKASGLSTIAPKSAFGIGAVFVICTTTILYTFLNGESANKAIQLAKAQYGDNYQYHITSLNKNLSKTNCCNNATLTLYSNNEIKKVEIRWVEEIANDIGQSPIKGTE